MQPGATSGATICRFHTGPPPPVPTLSGGPRTSGWSAPHRATTFYAPGANITLTAISRRPADDARQHARQRRAVAQRVMLPMSPRGGGPMMDRYLGCLRIAAVQYSWRGGFTEHPVNEHDPRFQVAVRASADGRFTFQIFTLSGEPRTFQASSQTYATPADAAKAGYEAIAANASSAPGTATTGPS
jgi:hypothetical protein